ncbi:Rab21/Rab5 family GTPase [Achlya hypogyna]|uniref:Ras-related protein Rab-21 n=1 Tax=Achlya hypogyna TaxID=1202772 RepID=A0A1V9Y9W9_ACHHY|nr:Rab21/Rab5 family GTPase [Achlya hypogyna]
MATKRYKVVLLGEGRVGKTSILLRYIRNEYDDRQVSTLQASYLDKKLTVDNQNLQLSLWDTAGQERFHALGPIYYRDADGALLVYDITDDESFKKVKTWVKELRRIVGEEIDIVIAGNKIDLKRNIKVTEADAVAYAKSVGATHFYTSAKLNRGLDDVFVDLSKRMLARGASRSKKNKPNAFIADDDEPMAPTASAAPSTEGRSRDGARGNTIQIVDDHRPSRASPHHGSAGPGSAKKSGCC